MPPALRKGPVSPARAAAVPVSPPSSPTPNRLPSALAPVPTGVARPARAVTR